MSKPLRGQGRIDLPNCARLSEDDRRGLRPDRVSKAASVCSCLVGGSRKIPVFIGVRPKNGREADDCRQT
jgi:hypothetical protein